MRVSGSESVNNSTSSRPEMVCLFHPAACLLLLAASTNAGKCAVERFAVLL